MAEVSGRRSLFYPGLGVQPFNPNLFFPQEPQSRAGYSTGVANTNEYELSYTPFQEPVAVNQAMYVFGATANDTFGGTGANTFYIKYLDQNMSGFFSETINAPGAVYAPTVNTNMCYIEQFLIASSGGGACNSGIVSNNVSGGFISNAASSVQSNFGYGQNHHYVPTGKTCYITDVFAANHMATAAQTAAIILRYRPFGWPQYGNGTGSFSWAGLADGLELARFRPVPRQGATVIKFNSPIIVQGPGRLNLFAQQDTVTNTQIYSGFNFYDI